jgi:hypothetical protein
MTAGVAAGLRATLREADRTNLAGQDTGRMALSHTRLSVFLACHRKFELSYVKRLESIRKPRPLSLGAAFQKAVELGDPEAGVLLLEGWTHENDTWTSPEAPVYFYDQAAQDQHDVDKAIVRGAARLYLETWPAHELEEREFEFRVQLRNPWTGAYSKTFDLHGYIDGLLPLLPSRNPDGSYRLLTCDEVIELTDHPVAWEIIENKLVGQVSPLKVQRLPLDRQLALERYATWRVTGRPVERVSYRWVKKPAIRRKKDETNADFCARVETDFAERPDFYLHEENPSWVTTDDLLRLECELWEWAEDVRAKLRADHGRRRLFDRNTSHCVEYGGCQFIPICTGDPDALSLYRVRPERNAATEVAPEAED